MSYLTWRCSNKSWRNFCIWIMSQWMAFESTNSVMLLILEIYSIKQNCVLFMWNVSSHCYKYSFRRLQPIITLRIAIQQRQAGTHVYYSSTAESTEISLPEYPSPWFGRTPQDLRSDWAWYASCASMVPKSSCEREETEPHFSYLKHLESELKEFEHHIMSWMIDNPALEK